MFRYKETSIRVCQVMEKDPEAIFVLSYIYSCDHMPENGLKYRPKHVAYM